MSRELVDSGVKWIGFVPKEWELKPLGTYLKERKEKVSDIDYEPLSVTKNGIVHQLENAAKSDAHDARKKVCIGDFVINSRSDRKQSCGLSNLDGSVSLINIVLDNRKYYSGYLKYLLDNNMFAEEFYSNGHGIVADLWTTRYDDMKKIILPMPSSQEQEKISKYLDSKISKIEEIINDNKKEIQLLEEYKKNLISSTVINGINNEDKKNVDCKWVRQIPVSWNISKIKYVCKFNPGYVEEFKNKEEVGYIPMDLLKLGYTEKSVIKIEKATSGLTKFVDEDIIMAKVTPCFENGEIAIVDGLKNGVGLGSSELFVFDCKKNLIMKEYLFYILQNEKLKEIYISTMTGTGGLKRVSPNKVKNSFIPVPSRKEQEQIVKHISKAVKKIEDTKKYRQQIISRLEEYKKSLIYETVTGKIEV